MIWIAKKTKKNQEQTSLIFNFLIADANLFYLKDIISYNINGTIKVKDRELNIEQAVALRESIVSLQNNWAYKIIKEQISYEAIKIGINKSFDMNGVLFAKAIIWINQQEEELIKNLTSNKEEIL